MKLSFEHHYQQKYLEINIEEGSTIASASDVLKLRQEWLANLSSWHSPYKAVINGSSLEFTAGLDRDDIRSSLERTQKLLTGFFLKKPLFMAFKRTTGIFLSPVLQQRRKRLTS